MAIVTFVANLFSQYLCECQFDDNVKFKTAINEEDPDKMRLQPIGRDKDGLMYWFQLDQDHNVRLYVEEQDDLDGSSWKCIVRYVRQCSKERGQKN